VTTPVESAANMSLLVYTPLDASGVAIFHVHSVGFGGNQSGFNVLCLNNDTDMNIAYETVYFASQNITTFMQVSNINLNSRSTLICVEKYVLRKLRLCGQ